MPVLTDAKVNARAARIAAQDSGFDITGLTADDLDAVQNVLAESLYDGWTEYKTQQRIRQLVGLTKRDQKAVANYRASLVKNGSSASGADRAAGKYAGRLRTHRARVIADFEVRKATHEARRELWEEARANGTISPYAVRVWKTHRDEKTCPVCKPLNGRRTSVVGGSYTSKSGGVTELLTPPAHPNCRCTEVLKIGNRIIKDAPELDDEAVEEISKDVRRVRTPDGVRHFKAPIGTPIIARKPLTTRTAQRLKKMFNLNDGEGRMETIVRRITDTIGVDPYDVNLKKVKNHCDEHERDAQSRFFFKSPCYHSKLTDFSVHRVLPEMMHEKYPKTAERLRRTSPRWGHKNINVSKVRRVRTPDGARYFNQPIGTVIIPGSGAARRAVSTVTDTSSRPSRRKARHDIETKRTTKRIKGIKTGLTSISTEETRTTGSRSEVLAARRQAVASVKGAERPDPESVEKVLLRVRKANRPGGDERGSSKDRKARGLNLMKRFSPEGKDYAPCIYCGLKLDSTGDKHVKMDQEKLLTFKHGGRYTMKHLAPACPGCNTDRSDADFPYAKPDWVDDWEESELPEIMDRVDRAYTEWKDQQ